jgi:hypothetical protein
VAEVEVQANIVKGMDPDGMIWCPMLATPGLVIDELPTAAQ